VRETWSRLSALLDAARNDLELPLPRLPEGKAREVESIRAALPRRDAAGAPADDWPAGPMAGAGAAAGEALDLADLDLVRRLEQDAQRVAAGRRALEGARGAAAGDGGARFVSAAKVLAKEIAESKTLVGSAQRSIRVLPHGSPEFSELVAPYVERLGPDWFRPRQMARLDPAGATWRRWRQGGSALNGIFEVAAGERLVLEGVSGGRTVLVPDAREVIVRDLSKRSSFDLLTLVLTRGRVRVSGTVHAVLAVGPAVELTIAPGTRIVGGLLLGGSHRGPPLVGTVVNDPAAAAGLTLEEARAKEGPGVWAVGLSPVPLWTEGDRS
jgi:hypothetical protein